MTEQCFLVKDVGDICDYGGAEVKVIAINNSFAWVWGLFCGSSPGLIVPLDDLKFIRSTVSEDFEKPLDHAVDPLNASRNHLCRR